MTTIDDRLPDESKPRFTPGRLILGVAVAASFGVWAYGLSGFADRTAPDTLGNSSYLAVAEPACAAANEAVEALPNALDARDSAQRAEQIRVSTAVYSDLVVELEGLLDDPRVDLNERDTGITLEWLADWRQFLADRLDYADRLAEDPQAVFYVAASSGGERLERRITRFADTNEMYSCETPADVG